MAPKPDVPDPSRGGGTGGPLDSRDAGQIYTAEEDSDSSEDLEHVVGSQGYHLVGSEPPAGHHHGGEDDDDDDDNDNDDQEEEESGSGLSLAEQVRQLVQQAGGEEANLSEDLRQTIAATRADQARQAAAELADVWMEKRESSITIDEKKAETIKNLMSSFRLPEACIPPWAKQVEDSDWRDKLLEKLNTKS